MKAIKILLFYPMLFLRGFLKIFLRILSGLLLIASVTLFLLGRPYESALIFGFMFMIFLLGWFYDSILLRLNPEKATIELTLVN